MVREIGGTSDQVDFRRSVAALGGDHLRKKLDRRRSRFCRLLCLQKPKRTLVTRTQRAELSVKSGAPVRGDPRWLRPSGTGPSVASGIIRFPDLWFVKSGERAIRWIFDGVRPPWAESWTSGVFDRRRSGDRFRLLTEVSALSGWSMPISLGHLDPFSPGQARS